MMDELRQFLSRDEHLAPAGFVTRVLSGCERGTVGLSRVETVDQLRKRYWKLQGVGAKCVAHLEHLFEVDHGRK
jgi:hypothetical protein